MDSLDIGKVVRVKKSWIIAALTISLVSYFGWNGYAFIRAFVVSDWVLETLEDHTNKPKSESNYQWLHSRNGELNAWNPISDSNIELARLDIELSLASLFYHRLSNHEVNVMATNVRGYLNSLDNDTRIIGKELQSLLDIRASRKTLTSSEMRSFKHVVAKQIRTDIHYLDDF